MASSRRKRRLRNERLGYLLITFVVGMTVSFAVLSRSDVRMNTLLARKVFRLERYLGQAVVPLKILFAIRGEGGTSGLLEALNRRDLTQAKVLLDSGVSPDVETPQGISALNLAISQGGIDIVRLLLSREAGANRIDSAGTVPLIAAAKRGDLALVEELIGSGADPNLLSPKGETALLAAIKEQNQQLIEILLAQRANVNLSGAGGVTPLLAAIKVGNSSIVSRLLDAGANVASRDRSGDTALIYAIRARSIPIAARILTTEIDPMLTNEKGESALDIARQAGGEVEAFIGRVVGIESSKVSPPIVEAVIPVNPSPNPTPTKSFTSSANFTRLRLVGQVDGIWKKQGVTVLTAVRLLVKNVGEFRAEGVQIQVRVPGGILVPIAGPTAIGKGDVAEYFSELNVVVKRQERLREDLNCKNCYR